MERRFWTVTVVFFMAVIICFLLVASQQITGTVSPAVASPQGQNQVDAAQLDDGGQWTTEHLTGSENPGSMTP